MIDNKSPGEVRYFRIEHIAESDFLVQFYTGFVSYQMCMNFFEFLGPSVYNLKYWGDKERD